MIICTISTLGLVFTLLRGDITPKKGHATTRSGESIVYNLVYNGLGNVDNYARVRDTEGREVTFYPECSEGE